MPSITVTFLRNGVGRFSPSLRSTPAPCARPPALLSRLLLLAALLLLFEPLAAPQLEDNYTMPDINITSRPTLPAAAARPSVLGEPYMHDSRSSFIYLLLFVDESISLGATAPFPSLTQLRRLRLFCAVPVY